MHRFSFAGGALLLTFLGAAFLLVSGATAASDDERGYLGVTLQDLSPSMAKALQLGDRTGVLVNEVMKDSPADKAGIEAGDVILEFAGTRTPDAAALTAAVREMDPGSPAEVSMLRDGREQTFTAALGTQPDLETWFDKEGGALELLPEDTWTVRDRSAAADRGYLGVHLDGLSEQLGTYFGVEDGKGALVTEVVKDSPAAAAGLKAGDVIVRMEGDSIDSPEALHEAMAETDPDQEIKIEVLRQGKRREFQVALAEMPAADLHAKMPLMLRRLHEGRDIMQIHPELRPDRKVEIRRLGPDDRELDQLKKELQDLRDQLDELRQEIRK